MSITIFSAWIPDLLNHEKIYSHPETVKNIAPGFTTCVTILSTALLQDYVLLW